MKKQALNKSRRDFITKGITGLAGTAILPGALRAEAEEKGAEEKEKKFVSRTLGKTGLKLPVISMGCGRSDDPDMIRAALDAGIVHLDTANTYSNGRNEEAIGQALKGRPRDSFVIATKIYTRQDNRTGLFPKDAKPEEFIGKFDTSLKRLGLEHVDILYLHDIIKKEAALYEPFLTAMEKFKKEGKIRFIGLATHRNEAEMLRVAADSKKYDVVLTAYNFRQTHRAEMDKAIQYAADAGIGIIAMKVLAGVYMDRERTEKVNVKAALKWVFQNKNICTAIPGFATHEEMALDLSVMENLALSPQETADLEKWQAQFMPALYCQQCEGCLAQCSADLDIPTLMRSYMYA